MRRVCLCMIALVMFLPLTGCLSAGASRAEQTSWDSCRKAEEAVVENYRNAEPLQAETPETWLQTIRRGQIVDGSGFFTAKLSRCRKACLERQKIYEDFLAKCPTGQFARSAKSIVKEARSDVQAIDRFEREQSEGRGGSLSIAFLAASFSGGGRRESSAFSNGEKVVERGRADGKTTYREFPDWKSYNEARRKEDLDRRIKEYETNGSHPSESELSDDIALLSYFLAASGPQRSPVEGSPIFLPLVIDWNTPPAVHKLMNEMEYRKSLIRAAAKSGERTLIPMIIPYLEDACVFYAEDSGKSYFPVRAEAALALKSLSGVDLGTDPTAWREWWEANKDKGATTWRE